MLHSLDSAEKRLRGSTVDIGIVQVLPVTVCSDLVSGTGGNLHSQWQSLGKSLKKLRQQIMRSQAFAFSFDEVYIPICMYVYLWQCLCFFAMQLFLPVSLTVVLHCCFYGTKLGT